MSEPSASSVAISFFAPFAGVGFAFLIDRLWERRENAISRKWLLQDVQGELTRAKALLEGLGNLVPTDIWESTLASGSGRLLEHEALAELSGLYFEIEGWNYEAKRARDVSDEARSKGLDKLDLANPKVTDANPLADYWIRISELLKESEAKLRQSIERILARPWWNPTQSTTPTTSGPPVQAPPSVVSSQNEFEREYGRSVVALGLLAVAVAYRVVLQPGSKFVIQPYFIDTSILLDWVIGFWVGYAILALIYLSDDVFPAPFRRNCHALSLLCLFLSPFALVFTSVSLFITLITPYPFSLLFMVLLGLFEALAMLRLFFSIYPRR